MGTIRSFGPDDFDRVWEIINQAAEAYRDVIPDDRWHEPYMGRDELQAEIDARVFFRLWCDEDGISRGVMGAQSVRDVTLIRHAYVDPAFQRQGVGASLIDDLLRRTSGQVLVGTWAAAAWAVSFYQRHGFRLVDEDEKTRLLKTYWNIPERQIETSVVLEKGN